jgi:hypothetical protein
MAGFDNNPPAMYSDRLAAFALVSDNLFNLTGNPLIVAGFGTFTPDSEPIAQAPSPDRIASRARG